MHSDAPELQKALAVAELLDHYDRNPLPDLVLRGERCDCGEELDQTGLTTPNHNILECSCCGANWIRDERTFELEQIFGFDGLD